MLPLRIFYTPSPPLCERLIWIGMSVDAIIIVFVNLIFYSVDLEFYSSSSDFCLRAKLVKLICVAR